jgi:hypothetical protein
MQLKLLALHRALQQELLWARFWVRQLRQLLVVVMIEMQVQELALFLVRLELVQGANEIRKILSTAA